MNKKRIIILGAGVAGLSAAWHLQKNNVECHVFEKESEVGGLCRSKTIDGFTFDYDGHPLHFKNPGMLEFVKNIMHGNLAEHKRSAWIYSHDTYIPYPFQANLYGLPLSVVKECLLGLVDVIGCERSRERKKRQVNFSYWIKNTFGKGIAKHFFIPYNTKFWTMPLDKLSCDWLDGFIPVPSLEQVIAGSIQRSRRSFGYNCKFWYPKTGGINQLPLSLARGVKNIHLNCGITEIDPKNKTISTTQGSKEKFDYLISTAALPELPGVIKGVPRDKLKLFNKLKWNSILNFNLGVTNKNNFGQHWVYFPKTETPFFRVGFYHNFSSSIAPKNKGALYVEAAYSKNRPIDRKDMVKMIVKELSRLDIIDSADNICVKDLNDIKYGYPIYDMNYAHIRKGILDYLASFGVIGCGRYGSWRYFSMEDSICDGRQVAKKIYENI